MLNRAVCLTYFVVVLSVLCEGDQGNPQQDDVFFILFTRSDPDTGQQFHYTDPFLPSEFNSDRSTVSLIHGFVDNFENSTWMSTMKDLILEKADVNAIIVDWGLLAGPDFDLAAANTYFTGVELSRLLQDLQVRGGLQLEDVTLVGFSFGAQVGAVTGYSSPGLGRITGLDPSYKTYQDDPLMYRLDPSDALFVDVLYTAYADRFPEPIGHVQFYPSGGIIQIGCRNDSEPTSCRHLLAVEYYMNSIWNNLFYGCECSDYDTFTKSNCISEFNWMGWSANGNRPGNFFLEVLTDEPYFAEQHKTTIILNTNEVVVGTLIFELQAVNTTSVYEIFNYLEEFGPQSDISAMITAPQDGGMPAQTIVMTYWKNDTVSSLTSLAIYSVDTINVLTGERYCIASQITLNSEIPQSFTPSTGACL